MNMNRRQLLRNFCIVSTALACQLPFSARANERAKRLFNEALFVNASDLTTVGRLPGHQSGPQFDAAYIAALKQGNVNIVSASLVFWLYDEFSEIAERLGAVHGLVQRYPDDLQLVLRKGDFGAAREPGKIALLMHAHTPSIIGGDLRRLEVLQQNGMRVLGFSHQQSSPLAEGAGEDLMQGDGGLSRFGAAVLEEANRLHVVADLGHGSDQSIIQAADLSSDPIVVSHTCVRALTRHEARSLYYRNISDEAILAVARNNGVVGIMALTPHLMTQGTARKPSVAVYLDHVEHVANLAGIDHVGIGTETAHGAGAGDMQQLMAGITARLGSNTPVIETFEAVAGLPPGTPLVVPGMEDMSRIKINLIEEMIRRGWTDEDIESVLGRNFLRVYTEVLPG